MDYDFWSTAVGYDGDVELWRIKFIKKKKNIDFLYEDVYGIFVYSIPYKCQVFILIIAFNLDI